MEDVDFCMNKDVVKDIGRLCFPHTKQFLVPVVFIALNQDFSHRTT